MVPVQALQPIALTATPVEDGIDLSWVDSGSATHYVIDRTGPDGTAQFVLPGSESSFTDVPDGLGTYSYQVTAQRGMEEDQSNPAAMAWPGCLPGPRTNPPGIFWPHHCYCPVPEQYDPLDSIICTTQN